MDLASELWRIGVSMNRALAGIPPETPESIHKAWEANCRERAALRAQGINVADEPEPGR